MSRKGENIYKRKDGRWEGRYIKSRKDSGKIVTEYELLLSNDGGRSYTSMGIVETPASEMTSYVLINSIKISGVTNVILRVLKVSANPGDNDFARLAEIKFYGEKDNDVHKEELIAAYPKC